MRRILAMIAGVILLLAAMAGTSAASSTNGSANQAPEAASFASVKAAAAPAGCPSSYFCFWANAGYSDGPGKLSGKNSDWSVFSHSSCPGGTWNDCASSDYNNGVSCDAVVWTGKSYGGTGGWVPKGTGGDFNSTFNNAVSSNSWGVYATGGTNSTCTGPVP